MIIREPAVHAIYYYLRQTPGDNLARQQERHEAFVADTHHLLQMLSGWLAITSLQSPTIRFWQADPPLEVQPLMPACTIEGRTNASAQLQAYVLRNMLLLRVSVARGGEHEQTVWSLLEQVLGQPPTTPSWQHTTRYWCGAAPRLPEELDAHHSPPIRTAFGVLSLGTPNDAHLLLYPDARTETRAASFLQSTAMQLDWYPVQARHSLNLYTNRFSSLMQSQQRALDQAARSAQWWTGQPASLRPLEPLRAELDTLETYYRETLADLHTTQTAAQEVRALAGGYRLALMQSGLWEAAPTVWEAQVSALIEIQSEIERSADYVDQTLRQMDTTLRLMQTRATLLHTERARLLIYLVALIGLAGLAVLIADTSLAQIVVRLLGLAAAAGLVWGVWWVSQQRRPD
jgi:hypothetical protein